MLRRGKSFMQCVGPRALLPQILLRSAVVFHGNTLLYPLLPTTTKALSTATCNLSRCSHAISHTVLQVKHGLLHMACVVLQRDLSDGNPPLCLVLVSMIPEAHATAVHRAAGGLDAERDQRQSLAAEQQKRERQAFEQLQEQRKASFRKV